MIDEFKELGRRASAGLAYACLDFGSWNFPRQSSWSWFSQGGEHAEILEPLYDEFVPDGYHWQILGPGHVRRLGRVPAGAANLPDDRIELTLGEPVDWLNETRAAGRGLLAPCLFTDSYASTLRTARWEAEGAGAP